MQIKILKNRFFGALGMPQSFFFILLIVWLIIDFHMIVSKLTCDLEKIDRLRESQCASRFFRFVFFAYLFDFLIGLLNGDDIGFFIKTIIKGIRLFKRL